MIKQLGPFVNRTRLLFRSPLYLDSLCKAFYKIVPLIFAEDRCKELDETVNQLREELASKNVLIQQREDGSELDHVRHQLDHAQNDLNQINERNHV